jgi:hypothetical protein
MTNQKENLMFDTEEIFWTSNGVQIRPEEMTYTHRANTINMMVKKVTKDLSTAKFKPSGFATHEEIERIAFEQQTKDVVESGPKAVLQYVFQHYPAIRRMAELNGLL